MRIVVCVRQGLDPQSVKISRSREELDLREARQRTMPEDKYALEAALRLKAGGEGAEVIALVVGGASAEDTTREAVAMGADKAILVVQKGLLGGKAVAALVQAAVERLGGADLILTGQPGDLDTIGPLAGRLAAALNMPLAMDVLSLDGGPEGVTAISACEGAGLRIPVTLPAVVEVIPGPERPRYPHPSRIAVAWQPEYVETWPAEELGVAAKMLEADAEMGGLVLGAERERGQVISGEPSEAAVELAGILRGRRLL